jgi:imidazole glycerol-phosphate synthase subunit HisH
VVDYGAGNLLSVQRRLVSVGATVVVSSNPEEIAKASKIILPGVGHFGQAMDNLRRGGLVEALNEAVLTRGVPILGICLGMQLMASSSTEGETRGLGWFSGSVVRFQVSDRLRFKVPHMGWNQVRRSKDSPLIDEIPDDSEFYFVHSYHYLPEGEGDALLTSEYGYPFTCGIARDNIHGVQFHPEKSHEAGMKMLRNFVQM